MGTKLGKNAFPAGHSPDDFKCFGPPATKDGEFEGTKICDMGCFMQEAVDSNKYYHGAIVQSTINQGFYVYFQYGRVGAGKPQFLFVECLGEADAEREYVKQLKSKNVGRGVWEDHDTLGRRLIPKVDKNGKPKDLYLVRAQQTRSTGLPDAKTITAGAAGLDQSKVKPGKTKRGTKKKKSNVDRQTTSLMNDLNVATVKYTRSAMADAALPTQDALDKGRAICIEAMKVVSEVGDDVEDQVNNRDLKQLTRDIYSIIPKKKDRGAAKETWILSQDNIGLWQQDLDAFESALYVTDLGDIEQSDPLGDLPIKMEWVDPKSDVGEFVYTWWPNATRNVHGYIGSMKAKNVWKVVRNGDEAKLRKYQQSITQSRWTTSERPLHQPRKRTDLTRDDAKLFVKSGTHLFFHGTRSVNVSGILRESLRLPRTLVGVQITGAMFGPGLYWADDWKKSAGYTSLRGSYYSGGSGSVRGRGAFMFAADVALGKPYVAPGPSGYTKAPRGYHSVFGKAGHSHVQNNEFITYERESHKLCYLMEFDT